MLLEWECSMQQISDTNAPPKSRRVFWIFYFATIFLLLGAIVCTFIQKQHEAARVQAIARAMAQTREAGGDVRDVRQQYIPNAKYWAIANLITFVLAILSWSIALWYREKYRRVWGHVIVLFAFYVLLQLIIV